MKEHYKNNFKIIKSINKSRSLILCLDCGCDFERDNNRIYKAGCPYCMGTFTKTGFNDINTTNPELVKYFVDKEITLHYRITSHKKVKMKCPNCGLICEKEIRCLAEDGFICEKCSVKGSYPEVVMKSLLNFLSVNYKYQKIFEWSKNKRYDFYIPEFDCIIETNGAQHYEETSFTTKSLKEEVHNDEFKKELALKNGIKNYITLDCKKSNFNYIRKSIVDNKMFNQLFDLSIVDWDYCKMNTIDKKLYKMILEKYNDGGSARTISDELKINRPMVAEYLRWCNKQKICKYNSETIENMRKRKASESIKNHYKTQIVCLNTKEIFTNFSDCEIKYGSPRSTISGCCNHKKHYTLSNKGTKMFWLYKEEYDTLNKKDIEEIMNFKEDYSYRGKMFGKPLINTITKEKYISKQEAVNNLNISFYKLEAMIKNNILKYEEK